MKTDYEIKDISIKYDDYFEKENISKETRDKLSTGDIVALPSCYQDGEYYFSQETINFLKFCKQNDSEHNYDILADGDIKVRSLHSFDIWLPIIWIANNIFYLWQLIWYVITYGKNVRGMRRKKHK